MRHVDRTVPWALLVLALVVLSGASGMAQSSSSRRGGSGFARALVSSTRSADIRESEDIYAPLEGEWDVETRDMLPDGSVVTGRGEWLFARVLEGRAFQDVWILPARVPGGPRRAHPANRYGTSVRMLDPTTREWRVTWLNPVSGAFDVLHARKEAGRIVQEGARPTDSASAGSSTSSRRTTSTGTARRSSRMAAGRRRRSSLAVGALPPAD